MEIAAEVQGTDDLKPAAARTPGDGPIMEDTLLSPNTRAKAVAWSVFIPANTLESKKNYILVAADMEGLASTSQILTTT
jgi:hypothetical protein